MLKSSVLVSASCVQNSKDTGSCNNVSENGGLLIVVPDEFSKPVTKFSIKMQEK